jgi:proline iminopeptidase
MTAPASARDRFVAFRRSLARPPKLTEQRVRTRGLDFAIFTTPEARRRPAVLRERRMLFDHKLLWPAFPAGGRPPTHSVRSARPRRQFSATRCTDRRIEHDAGDLHAIRLALGYRRWDVLGHSWGGGIATLGTERDRDGVRRLVLVNAVGPRSDSWLPSLHDAALRRLTGTERSLLQRLDPSHLHDGDPARHSAYARAMYPAWFSDPELAQLFAPPRSDSRTGAAIVARLRRDGYDWSALVRAVHTETLVLHGEDDSCRPQSPENLSP